MDLEEHLQCPQYRHFPHCQVYPLQVRSPPLPLMRPVYLATQGKSISEKLRQQCQHHNAQLVGSQKEVQIVITFIQMGLPPLVG